MSDLQPEIIPIMEREGKGLKEYLFVLLNRRWIILSFIIIFATISLLYSFLVTPVYKATACILLEPFGPEATATKEGETPVYYFDVMAYYGSQFEVLKSRVIADIVYEKLGNYDIWSNRKTSSPVASSTKEDKTNFLLTVIEIKPVFRSQLIKISARDPNPQAAARIANTWVEAYIFYTLVSKSEKAFEKEDAMILNQLMKRKVELEAKLAQESNYYKEKHPIIIGIKDELKSVEERIEAEKSKPLEAKNKTADLNYSTKEGETSKMIYNSLLNRLKEKKSLQGLRVSNIKVIEEASVPKFPIRPKIFLNFIFAVIFGLTSGVGVALFLEALDQTIKSAEELEENMHLPLLAFIPTYNSKNKVVPIELISLKEPLSTFAERYRTLRTSIVYSSPDTPKKSLVITSSGPQEGKTSVSTNVAIVFAQSGEKTILVDADLRKPKLHKIFGMDHSGGITEILANNEDPSRYIRHTELKNLDLLFCGTIPPNPAELLSSRSMEVLIKKLYEVYDRVIFDVPPALSVTDAVVLATRVDGVILLARREYTHRMALMKARDTIIAAHAKILGVVLNMVDTRRSGGYGYYNYYYNYGESKETKDI